MANLVCAKCNKEIEEENAVECPHCWEIYHKECWEELSNCVTCKKFNPVYEFVQAQKEAEEQMQQEEQAELQGEKRNVYGNETEKTELKEVVMPSHISEAVFLASNVVLVLGAVLGVAFAVYMFMTGGFKGGIIGIVAGVVMTVAGWVASILTKGFAELIENSKKNTYYLSKLSEQQEKTDEKE